MSINADQLLTVPQVAERLSLTTHGVYKLIQRGKLPAVRISERNTRIAQSALDNYVAEVQARVGRYLDAQPTADEADLFSAFKRETGMTPDSWLAAWKRDEFEDTPDTMALLVRAAGLREASHQVLSSR